MRLTLNKIVTKLVILIGLLVSSNVFACAPNEDSSLENTAQGIFLQETVFLQTHSLHSKESSSLHQHHSSQIDSSASPENGHEDCECCDLCRCVNCTGCTASGGSAIESFQDVRAMGFDSSQKIIQAKSIYISLPASPLEHPPR